MATIDQLKTELNALGIEYPPKATKATLERLLSEYMDVEVSEEPETPEIPEVAEVAEDLPEPVKTGRRVDLSQTSSNLLNVREIPEGTVLGYLKDEEEIAVIEDAGDWLKIDWQGREANVMSRYVR